MYAIIKVYILICTYNLSSENDIGNSLLIIIVGNSSSSSKLISTLRLLLYLVLRKQ